MKHHQFIASAVLLICLINNVAQAQCPISIQTSSTNPTCYSGTTGSITVNASGGTTPYQYQLSVAGALAWSSNNVFSGLAAGTHPVSVKDATGCISTIYVTLSQPPALAIQYTNINPTCAGSANGSLTTNVSGGTAPYTYNWRKNGVPYSTSNQLSNLAPGSYLLEVADAAGCSASPIVPQQISPLSMTGFNEDVIAEGTNVVSTTVSTQAVDNWNGNVFYATGYTTSYDNGTRGLPAGGSFASAQSSSRIYQLQPYSAPNALSLRSAIFNADGGSENGTLLLTSSHQIPYSDLYVVGTTGSGTGTVNYTIHFLDNSTYTGTLNFPDWYLPNSNSSTSRALGNLGRTSRNHTPESTDNSGDYNLFEAPISIPVAYQDKAIGSIDFAWAASSSARINIFAITGYTAGNGIIITDGPFLNVTPVVSINSDASSNEICSGQPVQFTATPINGGSSPSYQWKLNGADVGTNSPSYSNSGLNNNDQVSVVMTAAGGVACLSATTANSNIIVMTLTAKTATVTISGDNNICRGANASFNANAVNGGTTPSYQWKINGVNVGSNSASFSSNSFDNNDIVSLEMTSSIGCSVNNPATSNTLSVAVTDYLAPALSVNAAPATPGISLTSSWQDAGNNPIFQWYKNGFIINGATSSTYTDPSANAGDIYALELTSNYACPDPRIVSDHITITTNILPVLFEWFKLDVKINKTVMLQWKTSGEENAKLFRVERSDANGQFKVISVIAAANLLNGSTYSFLDNPASGIYLYRLAEEDIDGKKQYSPILMARIMGEQPFVVSNRGANWLLATNQILNYRVLDMQGKIIAKGACNGQQIITKPLNKGVYILETEVGGIWSSTKLF